MLISADTQIHITQRSIEIRTSSYYTMLISADTQLHITKRSLVLAHKCKLHTVYKCRPANGYYITKLHANIHNVSLRRQADTRTQPHDKTSTRLNWKERFYFQRFLFCLQLSFFFLEFNLSAIKYILFLITLRSVKKKLGKFYVHLKCV